MPTLLLRQFLRPKSPERGNCDRTNTLKLSIAAGGALFITLGTAGTAREYIAHSVDTLRAEATQILGSKSPL